jgi:hypothetical protein
MMSKKREGTPSEWAKHLRRKGKKVANKGERRVARRNLKSWS